MRDLNLHPITVLEAHDARTALRNSAAGLASYSPETLDILRWKVRNYVPRCGDCGAPLDDHRYRGICPDQLSPAASAAYQFHADHGYWPSDEQLAAWL